MGKTDEAEEAWAPAGGSFSLHRARHRKRRNLILAEGTPPRGCFETLGWQLLGTPLLIFGALTLFLVTGPGSASTVQALLFRNPALRIFGGVVQVLLAIWAFGLVLAMLRQAPRLRVREVLPLAAGDDRIVANVALQGSAVFAAMMAAYVGIYWQPLSADDDVYRVPVAPAVGQLFVYMVPLLALMLPGLAGWPRRRVFLRLVAKCLACVVGFSPAATVRFQHVLVTDIFTSMDTALYDIVFASCHFAHADFGSRTVIEDTEVRWQWWYGPWVWAKQKLTPKENGQVCRCLSHPVGLLLPPFAGIFVHPVVLTRISFRVLCPPSLAPLEPHPSNPFSTSLAKAATAATPRMHSLYFGVCPFGCDLSNAYVFTGATKQRATHGDEQAILSMLQILHSLSLGLCAL